MKSFLNLTSVDACLEMIFAFRPLGDELETLAQACGRRLARPFYAPADLPGFRRSAMDGYAVCASDVFGASEQSPALLQLAGECPVGVMPDFTLASGEAAAIVTGAPLPEGSDAVVMIEDSREAGAGQIEIIRPLAPGANIIESDDDARRGEELIGRGSLVRAQECGIFAAYGIDRVPVFRKPAVAILSSGNEVVPQDAVPAPGQVRDVNSASLDAFCRLHGAVPKSLGIVEDEPGKLLAALEPALDLADIVIVSGGSSAGMRDYTVDAFLGLPESRLLAHGVAMRPGKPFILAESKGKPLLGLPGHVTSALVCAWVFVGPLLAHMQGLPGPEPKPWLDATLSCSIASAQGRRDYVRCHLQETPDGLVAVPLRAPSAVLSSLLQADGFVICPENSEGLAQGQKVKFYTF